MRVNTTAHASLRSVIHVAGLKTPPKAIAALVKGSLLELNLTASLKELSAVGTGYAWIHLEGCFSLLVCPGRDGETGHSLFIQF